MTPPSETGHFFSKRYVDKAKGCHHVAARSALLVVIIGKMRGVILIVDFCVQGEIGDSGLLGFVSVFNLGGSVPISVLAPIKR